MENSKTNANPAQIIGNAAKMIVEDPLWVALTFFVLTMPSIWADIYLSEDDAFRFGAFLGVASMVPQILLIERTLWRYGLLDTVEGKRPSYFPRAFGQSLIGSIAIIIGLLALLLPGLLLMGRWSISLPTLIARNEGIVESLRTSWQLTEGRFWLCFVSIMGIWLLCIVIATAALLCISPSPLAEAVILESLLSTALLLSWFVAVALYVEIVGLKKVA